jgi:hypothetical protein
VWAIFGYSSFDFILTGVRIMCLLYLKFYVFVHFKFGLFVHFNFWFMFVCYFCQTLENKIRATVDEAVKKAKADKEIGLEELTTDIYADSKEPVIRGTTPWDKLEHKTLGMAVNV